MIPLKPLQGQVRALVEDLRGQVAALDGLRSELHSEYLDARRAERTAGTFETWLEDVLDQAAVAWVLGCVFVRFCEDNGLVSPLWIGGPSSTAPAERAVQNRQAYLMREETSLNNDMHWLREAFGYLRGLPATGKLFDAHNPVWRFDISGDAAEGLSDFFRRGPGFVSLSSDSLGTRFLGDLYQDLSAHARATYALLQTPEFVEEFILDRTFEPALREFGLARMSVIDPTCGSGHFLLGAFARLVRLWKERSPASDVRELVQGALHQVTGVDINPFAVAIARFRLMVAALRECGLSSLERAPAFDVRVATGDSLLPWGEKKTIEQPDLLLALAEDEPVFAYATEDADLLKEYLRPGQYTVVVGNPPYIIVRDKAQNERYRALYPEVAHRQYQLGVPFAKRFFDLGISSNDDGTNAAWVSQITSNAFMKREFGTKLVAYLQQVIELVEVIDTSGAYIPGHGTPTVILIGRRNRWRRSDTILAIFGIRGEPSQPDNAADGKVWTAITNQIDRAPSESPWISVTRVPRARLDKHPWSLSGGGAIDLMQSLSLGSTSKLAQHTEAIGFCAITGEDDAYLINRATIIRLGGLPNRPMAQGDDVRDFAVSASCVAAWPYESNLRPSIDHHSSLLPILWPSRRLLKERKRFGVIVDTIRDFVWYEFREFYRRRIEVPHSIAFADIVTHNHFAFDRKGQLFNRHAPVIKLPEGASEDEHLRLLGVLNSSTACFWLKQVSHDKGNRGGERSTARFEWEHFYEFTGTKLQEFPLPSGYPLERSRTIDGLAQRLATVTPAAVAESGVPTRERLEAARVEWHSIRAQMIALQEELDWEVYRLYGLLDEDLTVPEPPELQLGERAFEIVLARRVKDGETDTQWFARHNSTPVTEPPAHWPDAYRSTVERRIAVMASDRNIGLIERPECKRRWSTEGWDALQTKALRDWLLDRLEDGSLWGGAPTPQSVAQLADRVRHDADFRSVLDLWVGHDQHDLAKTLAKLVAEEHVPYLPVQRYKPAGLRKRVQWERTWALQRREDAGEKVDIEVPPKYASADFTKNSYWRNRGKLDVPKERFISYPGMGREGDPTELLGWAGWDHLGQAQAIATVYIDRKTQAGWPTDRLLPLLAGLIELEPWLHQWYADPRPGFPGTPADFISGLIDTELATLGKDRAELDRLRGAG